MLVKINGKTIYKINDNFFIDYSGIKGFTDLSIKNIDSLRDNYEIDFCKDYLSKVEISDSAIFSSNLKEEISDKYGRLIFNQHHYVSNGSLLVAMFELGLPLSMYYRSGGYRSLRKITLNTKITNSVKQNVWKFAELKINPLKIMLVN
ncbi:hypothetical protein N5T78_10335 [Aliarcobacter cryaerophilus]|uniref:hypothetical protein n=1 Tax=Aliarcobacter cryaerophilus TaxID=28198 RepID=UPI0021B63E5B|nr:hypothetical protein [Aliarcobacter cryaerophilus]MCT7466979.1 hypothetical protein [Aliarcobacter cryaerophilus]